ncbi:MAG: PepSY domain-containing protein [Lachnospiraceae bacterium]|nr:PepSY domain-containing protein [Lachnospiraceae bacterium]
MKKKIVGILTGILIAGTIVGCGTNDGKQVKTQTQKQEENVDENKTNGDTAVTTEENENTAAAPSETSGTPAEDKVVNAAVLSGDEAFQIALDDAQVAGTEVTNMRVRQETENGKVIYDVEFYAGVMEYDYEIDAETGAILEKDMEIEDDFQAVDLAVSVSKEEAVKLLLEKVPGASEQNIHMKLEEDDGRVVYEGEVLYDKKEYDFEISAQTGEILSWEVENWNE